MLSAGELWSLLYDEYLPFSLYASHRNGATFEQLADRTGIPVEWVQERIRAADTCIGSGQKLTPPALERRAHDRGRAEGDRRNYSRRDAA